MCRDVIACVRTLVRAVIVVLRLITIDVTTNTAILKWNCFGIPGIFELLDVRTN